MRSYELVMPLRLPLNCGITYRANSSSDLYQFSVEVHSSVSMSSAPKPPLSSCNASIRLMQWSGSPMIQLRWSTICPKVISSSGWPG